jgi:hypothetical protein
MLGIQYSEIAVRQLKAIARSNKQNAVLILKKIEQFARSPEELTMLKY